MKGTRRAVVAVPGAAVLGLVACSADGSSPTSTPSGSSEPTATEATAADPDQVALDRAVAITAGLLAALQASPTGLDPGARLEALHAAHLDALDDATDLGSGASASVPSASVPSAAVPSVPGTPLTPARLRRRELSAQRELARLALAAGSGALARVFASMSAGVAAALASRTTGTP